MKRKLGQTTGEGRGSWAHGVTTLGPGTSSPGSRPVRHRSQVATRVGPLPDQAPSVSALPGQSWPALTPRKDGKETARRASCCHDSVWANALPVGP